MPQLNSIETYTMTNAGAAVTWAVTDPTVRYILNGSATLAGSYTFAESGTPVSGMVYIVDYNAQMTLNGNNITIFGRQLTQEEALKKFTLVAVYENASFQTWILPEIGVTGRFYHGVTTTTVPSGGGTVSLNPATSKGFQVYNSGAGTVTLTSDYTITTTGTPTEGDEFFVLWSGTVYPDGNTVTIFGETLTDSQVTNGDVLIHAVYNGSAWVVLQGATNAASTVVSKSYAQLQTMVAAGTLEINRKYFINDRNIWVTAVEVNKFALQGEFKMLAPDYQDASGIFGGVWISTMALPTIGDLYSYNNFMWENLTGAVGTAPTGDAVNWVCVGTYGSGTWKDWVNKTGSEYQTEIYSCEYDFANDWVNVIHDVSRGNKIGGSYRYEQYISNGFNVVDKFQWGNNNHISNSAIESYLSNVNSLGSYSGNELSPFSSIYGNVLASTSAISGNIIAQGATIHTNTLVGTADINGNTLLSGASINTNTLATGSSIHQNTIHSDCEIANKTLNANVDFDDNIVGFAINLAETITVDQINKTCIVGLSTFSYTLDLDTAIYAGTTLTIPTYLDYIGVFTLTSGLAKTITVIVNLPTNHEVTFFGVNGITYTFTSAAVGSAAAGNPVRTAGAGNDLLVGRTNGGDKIVMQKAGTLCRISYADILT